MALTNREQKIMILAVSALLILIGDRYVLSPILAARSEVSRQKEQLAAQLDESLALLERARILKPRWNGMLENGLSYDVEKTEAAVLRYIENSSGQSGFSITSIQPEHLPVKEKFGTIEFMVSGSGSMESVTRFLWAIETANVPLKISTFQLGANNENADVMSLQLNMTSIYLIDEQTTEGN